MATDIERVPRERDGSKDAVRAARSFLRDSFGHYAVRAGRRRKGIRTLTGTGVRAVIVNDRGDVDAALRSISPVRTCGRQRLLFTDHVLLREESRKVVDAGVPVLGLMGRGEWEADGQASRDMIKKATSRARRVLISFIISLILSISGAAVLIEASLTGRPSGMPLAADKMIASFMVLIALIIFIFAMRSWYRMRRGDDLRQRAQAPVGTVPGRWPRFEAKHAPAPIIMIASIVIALLIYRI